MQKYSDTTHYNPQGMQVRIDMKLVYSAQWANSWGQKVVLFLKNRLTWSVLELEKCFVFFKWAEFCQKLIGTIIMVLVWHQILIKKTTSVGPLLN